MFLIRKLCSSFARTALASAPLLMALPAQADLILGVPTNWRLQDYGDGVVHLWFTGSQCTSGGLVLLSSVPEGSKARLFSLVLTAKTTNRPIGIYYHYDSTTTNCVIDSFYTDGPN